VANHAAGIGGVVDVYSVISPMLSELFKWIGVCSFQISDNHQDTEDPVRDKATSHPKHGTPIMFIHLMILLSFKNR